MKLKQVFCKHNWLWVGCRHITDSKGYIIKTYQQMRREKCDRQYEPLSDEFKLQGKIKKAF